MKRLLSIILSVSLVLLQAPLSNASLAYALDNDLTQARQDVAKSMGMTLPSTSEELDWDAIESDESIAKDRLVISFMPEVSLDEAQKFVSSKDWKADGCVISWKDNGLKCFAVTLPSDSTLKKCMEQAEASSLVLTVELDAICKMSDPVVNDLNRTDASKCFDNFERLWGEYALDTMTAISNEAFLNTEQEGLSEGSDYAIVCTMASYYDALSAAGLAGILDCPVLITDSSSLSTQTAQELQRLGVSKVYIAGGLSALSSDVESEIASLDCVESTERIAGENARQTATEIFDEGNTEGTWGDTALITTWRSYYDGLSASSYAYAQKAPLFITDTNDELDSYSLDALEEGGFTKVVILGGTAAVSPTVESQLQTLSTNVEVSRMAGENAYETAKLFAERGLNDGMSAENMCFTTVLSYYDALCASSLAGRLNAPILYADIYTDGSDYSIQAQRFVQDYFVQFEQGYILGGTSALSDNVVVSLTRALLWSD